MKKLFSITLAIIVSLSIILSSCTEEQIKVTGDSNDKTESGSRPK